MATRITKEVAQEILARFQRGETTLAEERARLGLKQNGGIRKAVTALLDGNKEAFHALVTAKKRPRALA